MVVRLLAAYHLLPTPTGLLGPEALQTTSEGFRLRPAGQDLYMNQGDDPPSGGSGSGRSRFKTMHGAESARAQERIGSTHVQERVQSRLDEIADVLRESQDYGEQIKTFERGFDFDVEVMALHRLVEGDWGNEDMEKELGEQAWMIRLMSVRAYVGLHTKLSTITIENQQRALAVLRGWLRTTETAIAGSVLINYKAFVQDIVESNTSKPDSVSDLIELEIKALKISMIENPAESPGKERERQADEFLQELSLNQLIQ